MRITVSEDEMHQIRHMKKHKLEEFLTEIYLKGREDGFNRKGEVKRLEQVLEKVKYIGQKRKELIIELYDYRCRMETGEVRKNDGG